MLSFSHYSINGLSVSGPGEGNRDLERCNPGERDYIAPRGVHCWMIAMKACRSVDERL